MTTFKTNLEIKKAAREIAAYFAGKSPSEIQFRDADFYEFQIYQLNQSWDKINPKIPFTAEFAILSELQGFLAWSHDEPWDKERCEWIIRLAKLYLEADDFKLSHPNYKF